MRPAPPPCRESRSWEALIAADGQPPNNPHGIAAQPAGKVARPRFHSARASRVAVGGLAVVLLALSGFAVWAAQRNDRGAAAAESSSRLSESYATARTQLLRQQAAASAYRLDAGRAALVAFRQGTQPFLTTVGDIQDQAGGDGQRIGQQLFTQYQEYVAACHRAFAARDSNDRPVESTAWAAAQRSLGGLEGTLDQAATHSHVTALLQMTQLRQTNQTVLWATPVAYTLGLLMLLLFGLIIRAYRRHIHDQSTSFREQALRDPLTRLPNRTLLADRVSQALSAAARDRTRLALLLIDLDRFKDVNDTLGHQYGDDLLGQVAERLRLLVRDSDTVARLGGDEFAVLLPGCAQAEDGLVVADKIRQAIEAPFELDGIRLELEASIGVALSGPQAGDLTTLLQQADMAMYSAKNSGQSVCVYEESLNTHSRERLALLGGLRRAIGDGELRVHYQPKADLSSGQVTGTEALVRWQHPELGLLGPDRFIPLAERSGLIYPLTSFVLNTALEQCARWRSEGLQLSVAVNVSARSLLDSSLATDVATALGRHGVDPSQLEIEITESAVMADPVRAREVLQRLADIGVRLAIDDFGTGYSSLGYLQTLPVHELKIDRSFVSRMHHDRSNRMIVKSVVELGHNLGLRTVAEGIEDEATWNQLARFGCDIGQGFHLERPMPAETLTGWLSTRSRTRRPAVLTSTTLPGGLTLAG